jgi:hypothetical protein
MILSFSFSLIGHLYNQKKRKDESKHRLETIKNIKNEVIALVHYVRASILKYDGT